MEHESLFQDPHFWVLVSFIIFVASVFKPLARKLNTALDARSARIADELNQARKLREEAETVLSDYKRRQADVIRETDLILKRTQAEADQLRQQAKKDLEQSLEKRSKAAMEKIAQAETKAVFEVQNHMVDVAVAAARAIIKDYVAQGGGDEIVRQAITDMERKLH